MKSQPVRYAIIRFQPYIETEEFANVGVVLVAPAIGYFDFLLETRRIARFTAFFDQFTGKTVRTLLHAYSRELSRIRELSGHDPNGQQSFDLRHEERPDHLFAALTKDREGVINYSDVRVALHGDPKRMLQELFDRYVSRSFGEHESPESRMEQALRRAIRRESLNDRIRAHRFDDGLYSAYFPFVGYRDGEQAIALKPIFLGQTEPKRILEHANKWQFAVGRLREQLPANVTFAVKGPAATGPQQRAFDEASQLLREAGAQIVNSEAEVLEAITSRLQ